MVNVLEYLEHTVKNEELRDKPAFITDKHELSFMRLYNITRSVGSYLCEKGIYQKPVVVFMERTPDMIAAFLGVVAGGCYYVPLDASMPLLRIQLILKTCSPPLIICDEATAGLLGNPDLQIDYAEITTFGDIKDYPPDGTALALVRSRSVDLNPLYVVFTSGSTGVPKGITSTHRAVIDYTEHLTGILDVSSDTVFGMQSPLYLDACLKEIYSTLKYGASTYLIPASLFMFPVQLIKYITDNRINTICWVASALGMAAGLGALDEQIPHTLKTVAFGSEVFPVKHYNSWRKALPEARFIHLYGPTEATGMSTYYYADKFFEPDEVIPIGKAFPNKEIVLLDENNLVPKAGDIGEICIRGTGLSLGYYNDPGRTEAVFVQNPLSPFPDRIYKTGDLGYLREDGQLCFVSRKDHQIKHMGHRIELAEIEWVASSCEDIGLVCAVFDDKTSRIALYCLAPDTDVPRIKAFLKKNLPRYMMPYAVFILDEMPLTPGGKTDRAGLLEKFRSGQ